MADLNAKGVDGTLTGTLVLVNPRPTAEWIARQVTETFPWDEAPRYLIRDRDRAYGAAFTHRLRAMGIREARLGRTASPKD